MAFRIVVLTLGILMLQLMPRLAWAQDVEMYFSASKPASTEVIMHEKFDQFLREWVLYGADGVGRFHYGEIVKSDKDALKSYLTQMAKIKITHYHRKEQLAYWLNLYNAVVINMVLQEYPIKTIKEASSPWSSQKITVEGHGLSLDNIEHDIIRAIFQDFRIHFAINSAAYGSGGVTKTAYTGKNLEMNLEQVTKDFLSHDRGLSIMGKKVQVSTIFKWYRDDFGGSDEDILRIIKKYTSDAKRAQLKKHKMVRFDYQFDWQLNDTATMF